MNHLQIVQEACRLAAISDGGGPSTVIGQTGDYQKMIRYVAMAHEEIQNEFFDWNFLWGTSVLSTSSDVAAYTGQSDLGIWDVENVWYAGIQLDVIDYQEYVPQTISNGPPQYAVIRPDNQLMLVPTPDSAYQINYDYFRKPMVLVKNDDQPYIPNEYQMVIVGRALILYGNFESAEETKVQGEELYAKYMKALQNKCLPRNAQRFGRHESVPITVIVE